MALLDVVPADRAGLDFIGDAAAVAAGGDYFVNTGRELLIIANAGIAGITLTIQTPATVDGQAVADRAVTVGAASSLLIGPFPVGIYNDGNGVVQLTYSDDADVTVYVFKVP